MGLFINLMAIKHPDRAAAVSAVTRALERQKVTLHRDEPKKFDDRMYEFDSQDGWSYLDFRWAIWDYEAVLREVSRALETAVFFFQIYDGDYWTYHLYDGGDFVGKFASVLDYWEEPWDAGEWSGNLPRVKALFQAEDPLLGRYLKHLGTAGEDGSKIDPADEFELSDPWVFVDFMKRLGLTYPDASAPVATHYLVNNRAAAPDA